MIPHGVIEHFSEQSSSLTEITVGMVGLVPGNEPSHLIRLISGLRVEGEGILAIVDGIGLIVRERS